MTFLPTLEAVRYDRKFSTGRTEPVVCGCISSDSKVTGDYVVKLKSKLDRGVTALSAELVGCLLARRLGIPTLEPAIISVTDEFAQSVVGLNSQLGKTFTDSIGLNYGSKLVVDKSIPLVGQNIPAKLFSEAFKVFAFDALIQNPDRRPEKPNLFITGSEIIVFDHEMAFSFLNLILPPSEPWLLSGESYLRGHLFYRELKGASVDFAGLRDLLSGISDGELEVMFDLIPQAWMGSFLNPMLVHIKGVRDNSDLFINELRSLLI